MNSDSPITSVKGVGEALARKLQAIGVSTINDIIEMLPRRYEDYTEVSPIATLRPGVVTIKGDISHPKGRYVRRGMHVTEAIATDETGSVRLVWFNQPYRAAAIDPHSTYFIRGEFALSRQKFSVMNPSIELVKDFPLHSARIVPIYKTTKGLTSLQIRKIIKEVIDIVMGLPETLPEWLISENSLLPRKQAVLELHFPSSVEMLKKAQRRLGFEEVFRLTLASLLNKYENAHDKSVHVDFGQQVAKDFVSNLPFQLTDDQRRVAWQIFTDMQSEYPMNRLVEGDVGSGKTVVATMAAVMAMNAGYQVMLMAPTEILAQQHAKTIRTILAPLKLDHEAGLLIGSLSSQKKRSLHNEIQAGKVKFVIGTHALFQDKVATQNLGLVIIDEQHRFGVEQRKKLMSKARVLPHLLALTATPIPRSLALTLYGELDISVINSKPAGRQEVITDIISPNSVEKMYKSALSEIENGRQVFVVCPAIIDTGNKIMSVEKVYEEMKNKHFPHKKVGLVHGQMPSQQKEEIMNGFHDHAVDVIVATTVIEVGVDVPNATVMIILSAERFGLAQIHQLRGRIGRGIHQGYCYLVPSDNTVNRRLELLKNSNDGFRLAELDLELRGPGAIYGHMQHGELDLRVAKLSDTKLIEESRQAAQQFIDRQEKLINYKELNDRVILLRTITNLN